MVSLNKKSLAFILYDWATSPITTIHTTFIFSVYFVNSIADKSGSFFWGLIIKNNRSLVGNNSDLFVF